MKLKSTFNNGMRFISASQSTNKDNWKRQYRLQKLKNRGKENHAKKQYKQLWEVTFLKQTTVVAALYKPNKT